MPALWITAEDTADPTHPLAPQAAEIASLMLYKLSGEKYPGTLTVTEWYGTSRDCCLICASPGMVPHAHLSAGHNTKAVRLRGRPVKTIVSVETADGVLAPSGYRVENRAVLSRVDGYWNLNSGVTVTYSYGMNPPAAGYAAAVALANEYLLLLDDPDKCALPSHVTSVTRQGMTFELADLEKLVAAKQTGIWDIDMFVQTFNPSGALKRARVFVPEQPRGVRYL